MKQATQLKEARSEAKKSIESAGEAVEASKRAISQSVASAQASAAGATEVARQKLVEAGEFASAKAEAAREGSVRTVAKTRASMRKRPFATAAASALAGLTAGYLWARSKRPTSRRENGDGK